MSKLKLRETTTKIDGQPADYWQVVDADGYVYCGATSKASAAWELDRVSKSLWAWRAPRDHVVTVTLMVDYIVPAYVQIGNGQTLEEILKSWFEDFDINRYHATRDGCCIGNSKTLLAVSAPRRTSSRT